jgi:hypothetical protein
VLEACGGLRCARCGYDEDWRALQVDHVEGGGSRVRSEFSYQGAYYDAIIEGDGEGLQVLCANCHQIVSYERKGNITDRDVLGASAS